MKKSLKSIEIKLAQSSLINCLTQKKLKGGTGDPIVEFALPSNNNGNSLMP